MPKTLIIVESPTKAKTISKFLGTNYTVVSSMGHVRDLPKSKFGIDTDKTFQLQYQIPSKAKKTVANLKEKAAKVDEVIIATDEDREGEAIAWHLAYILKLNPLTTKRMVFHEITKSAINEALKNPRFLDENLVDAQQARRALDRIVGYKLSPWIWSKVRIGLSAGRVQSVALRLIVDREREIQAFQAQEFWKIFGHFRASEGDLVTELYEIDGKKYKKFDIVNQASADSLVNRLQILEYSIQKIEKKQSSSMPGAPFITSSLQREAARKLYFSAKQTMTVAQKLYEGIPLGERGQVGLITYMRTDSVNLSEQAIQTGRKEIAKLYGSEYVSDKPRRYKTKSKNAQEAHEAIRPTDPTIHPDLIKGYLEENQYKLYALIWGRFMATQMKPALYDLTNVYVASNDHSAIFKASGKVLQFEGYLKAYPDKKDDSFLPETTEGEKLTNAIISGEQNFTQPPARYSESSLVKALEDHEIGRPSTYASIISTIQARGYVEKNDDRRFFPTETGIIVTDMLVAHFAQIVDIEFTARMEQQFDDIAQGNHTYNQTIQEFYKPFIEQIEEKTKSVPKYEVKLDRKCPECKDGELVEKMGRFGKFIACSNYPTCKYTEQTEEEKQLSETIEEKKCSACGEGLMQVKRGRFGPFLGCSRYPECKNIEKIEEKTGETCPKCEKGELVWKKGRSRGLKFKACNRYPDCDYIENKKNTQRTAKPTSKTKATKKAKKPNTNIKKSSS